MKIFICTNTNQFIGAKVAKQSIINRSNFSDNDITILCESDYPELQNFFSLPYKRSGRFILHEKNDMQSFTLLRFKIPELMKFQGTALVIDPDIFLVNHGLEELVSYAMDECSIYARPGLKKGVWASSVMLLNCKDLHHWHLGDLINAMHQGFLDYDDLISLKQETRIIFPLASKWNEFDVLKSNTVLLHTTEKITQPWRTGLPLNSRIPPLFYFIPRAPVYKIFGKNLTIGREHPDQAVTNFFMGELSACIKEGIITDKDMQNAIAHNFLRKDIWQILGKFSA